jgi:hypothetical protein
VCPFRGVAGSGEDGLIHHLLRRYKAGLCNLPVFAIPACQVRHGVHTATPCVTRRDACLAFVLFL